MHSPALGLSYQLWRRARVPLLVVAGYLVFIVLFQLFVPMGGRKDDDALMLAFPFFPAFVYLAGLLAYGDADLGARESCFPRFMMTLPTSNWALVGWPMLIAMGFAAILWIALATLLLRPCGLNVPIAWPAALLAAVMATDHASVIWPFGLRFARLVALLGAAGVLIAVAAWYGSSSENHGFMICFYLAVMAGSYLMAVRGLTLARRGDGTHWRGFSILGGLPLDALRRRRTPFSSPDAAQRWFEFFRNSWIVTGQVVLITVCLWGAVIGISSNPRPIALASGDRLIEINPLVFIAGIALLIPPLMALFMGNQLGKSDTWSKHLGMLSFIAVRPFSTVEIVAAKFRTALWITLITYGIVLFSVVSWGLLLRGPAEQLYSSLFPVGLTFKGAAGIFLFLLVLLGATWKAQAVSLWLTLSGRGWLTWTAFFGCLALVMIANIAGAVLYRHPAWLASFKEFFQAGAPYLVGGLVLLKLSLSAYTVRALNERRLADRDRVIRWIMLWAVTVALLFTFSWWLLPSERVRVAYLLAGCILLVPFARLALAPVMLHWNRHR